MVLKESDMEPRIARFLLSGLTLAAGAASLPTGALAKDVEHYLQHDRQVRSYLLHIPDAAVTNSPRPIVMVLHGGGGNAANVARMTHMSAIADRENFLVVYPNGSGRMRSALLTWNAGNCCGTARDAQVDDVGFLNAVIDDVARRHRVDPHRIYAAGMSNGGMMVYRLACETPARFAAVAPVAGAMNIECHPPVPLSIMAFHGTADAHVRYEGGEPIKNRDSQPRTDTPVLQTMAFWSTRNGCQSYTVSQVAEVKTETMGQCQDGTEVVLNTLEGFGHAWPGGERGTPWADDPTASIDASEAIWSFFKRHTR